MGYCNMSCDFYYRMCLIYYKNLIVFIIRNIELQTNMKTLLSTKSVKLRTMSIIVEVYRYETGAKYYDITYIANNKNSNIPEGEIIPKCYITVQIINILLQVNITDDDMEKIRKLRKHVNSLTDARIWDLQNNACDSCDKETFDVCFDQMLKVDRTKRRRKIMNAISILWA